MTFACNACCKYIDAADKPKRCPHCNSKRVVVVTGNLD